MNANWVPALRKKQADQGDSRFLRSLKCNGMHSAQVSWEGCQRGPTKRSGVSDIITLVAMCTFACVAEGSAASPMQQLPCIDWFMVPAPPSQGTAHNGIALPDTCFNHSGEYHVFAIGDWGGVLGTSSTIPVPADKRSKRFPAFHRKFVNGVDDCAQIRVAEQMKLRSPLSKPDYILNMGDNFYWGGVDGVCGTPATQHLHTGQWRNVFEHIYNGPGLDGKQWLGVLGNHDYGGYQFTSAWDQVIAYTWGGSHSTGRWVLPAQYWSAKVNYPGFSVDYFFVDSNYHTTFPRDHDQEHNLCGAAHNADDASCGPQGPISLQDCPGWFKRLWQSQIEWLDRHLQQSIATWQIVVTHFPPIWGKKAWTELAHGGIDIILSGHRHSQDVWGPTSVDNFLQPTAVVISGGGGGITSEGIPHKEGEDDQYGFMDLTLTQKSIKIEAISHGGQVRSSTRVFPRRSRAEIRREAEDALRHRAEERERLRRAEAAAKRRKEALAQKEAEALKKQVDMKVEHMATPVETKSVAESVSQAEEEYQQRRDMGELLRAAGALQMQARAQASEAVLDREEHQGGNSGRLASAAVADLTPEERLTNALSHGPPSMVWPSHLQATTHSDNFV